LELSSVGVYHHHLEKNGEFEREMARDGEKGTYGERKRKTSGPPLASELEKESLTALLSSSVPSILHTFFTHYSFHSLGIVSFLGIAG
jgi:hypothetical protein